MADSQPVNAAAIANELRRQRELPGAVWPTSLLKHIMPLCDAHDAMRASLIEARAFIAAERQTHVECSTHPITHQMDADDFAHAEDITALLERIDTALGGTAE
ncbi:hypothetical protein [Pseudazoarcus pumilus]|uniref:Uncharacterized protein n=1 Tax=Pseudazoarcus pumilus TaxID=2067960 RepID=A0A2I6S844_9RHOO|nr:hypothetical protein [Pseudazoarcus pumilus]AUN95440.1 hypothetical protein C0099_11175 [Pseudazoarcus pumilus]